MEQALDHIFTQIDDKQRLALVSGADYLWGDFKRDIAHIAGYVAPKKGKYWALCYDDSLQFLSALFAVLLSGRVPVLLPNNQMGTRSNFAQEYDEILSDGMGFNSQPADLNWTLEPQQRIIIFTSGTTGEPKRVERSLLQLQTEIKVLEQQFGLALNNRIICATVSHQHIYGLIFYLLWPLCYQRPICWPVLSVPEHIKLRALQYEQIALITTPSILQRLPGDKDFPQTVVSFSSGGLLNQSAAKRAEHYLGDFPYEILGSTETSGVAYRQQCHEQALWTVLPKVEILAKIDNEQALVVRSPFFNAPATGFTMGDTIILQADGRLQLLGRHDRIAKIEGKRVSLTAVEQTVAKHPFVSEAYALVLTKQRQALALVIALTAEGCEYLLQHNKQALNHVLQEYLAPYYDAVILPKYFRYVNDLPLNRQGKKVLTTLQDLFTPTGFTTPLVLKEQQVNDHTLELLLHNPKELAYFQGHFDSQPILAGVAQIKLVTEFIKIYWQLESCHWRNIPQLKFTRVIRPEMVVKLSVQRHEQRVSFSFSTKDVIISQGKLS